MHRARKRFGQHFLHDPTVIARIVQAIDPRAGEHLVEIGPGLGVLTEALLTSGCQLDAIELDRDLVAELQHRFGQRAHIIERDALTVDFATLQRAQEKLRVVGNLPYNISTRLIFHLLNYSQCVADMHFMLQREVVDRLAAQPGNKHYGRLSVMTQYYCRVEALFTVPPGAFRPPPKVVSKVVRLVPHRQLSHPVVDIDTLQLLLRTVFNQRRKTLRNSLATLFSKEKMAMLPIDLNARPETLSLTTFVEVSNFLSKLRNTKNDSLV